MNEPIISEEEFAEIFNRMTSEQQEAAIQILKDMLEQGE